MFVSTILLLFVTFTSVNCIDSFDDTNLANSFDDKNLTNTFDDKNFKEFYNCFENCATSNSVDLNKLDDLFSDDKICNTLTTNKNVVNFMKCYINDCKLDINVLPNNTIPTPSQKIDDKKFNCPGFDPTIFSNNSPNLPSSPDDSNSSNDNVTDNSKKSTSNSYKNKHFGYISILIMLLFNV